MNQTFIRCLDNELKTAALKKHANHKQTPREPEMTFKNLVDKIDQMDLTRTITNNHKRLYEVNQTTNSIYDDLKQMNIACNNINDLNQNDLEQFEGTICNVLNGINNTYDRKNFKGRPKFALFCSYCSSHGHTKGRCFKRPRRESIPRPKEKSFYGHMRNNQNLPNRRIDSNNVNGRQLPSTSPVYNSSRSRTTYRPQSRNNYNTPNDQRNKNYNNYNNRNLSYNRNNYNRSRTNSWNRSNDYNSRNNSRSNSRYNSQTRPQSPYNNNNNRNNNYNNNYDRQRYNSRDSSRRDNYRNRSISDSRHNSNDYRTNTNNNNVRKDRRNSSNREYNNRDRSQDRRSNGHKYNNNNKNRINSIEAERQNEDPPGIDEYEYTSDSSNEDQEILDKFYNANEETCNNIVNALENNPTWILPMYQCNKFEQDFTKQKPILEIDFLLDSGATLNLINEDTWNEIQYNNPEIRLERANKTLTAANNTTIETLGTITLNLTTDRVSNNRNKLQHNFNIHFYITKCNHNILGTPFFKEYIETINVNTNKLTINTSTILDNDITFFMNSTKGYPYYSRLYPIFNKEKIYLDREQNKCITFPIPIFKQMDNSKGKKLYSSKHYFEPINKYQNISFTDIKDLTSETEHFIDIFLINKQQHKITINEGLIGFMYQNITFIKQNEEMYQTNSIDFFTALYFLTYENENDINEILNIQQNETIEQVATFERKPNFKCKFNIHKYTESEKEFIQMFDFQHSYLTQDEFEKIVKIILDYKQVYATTKFDVGKTKVKLNLPIKKDAIFKKQRISKVPIHLRERIQKLLDVLKKYDIIAPVNKEQLSTGNTFTNPVIILRKGESLKIVLDARYLNSMIDESKCNWPIEPVDVALTRINGTIFTTADLNSAYNQIPLDEESMRYTHFTIGNEQYCFKRLFYGISIGPAAFASILTHFLYPLIRKGTVITYVDDIFIQTNSYELMYETLVEYHKVLLKENLKAAPDKTYFMLKKVKFLGHIIENKTIKPLSSRIDGFQKLEPPKSMKALQRYLGTINFLAKYVYGMQQILQPFYTLLHKETDFKWTKEHQQIFEQMKKTITHNLELTMPDTTQPFYIITDASNTGIGAALLQQHPTEKKMKLISANSRLFTPIEMRLSTLIRECSAIIFALTEYEFLLTGSKHPIVLFTDHKPIIYLFTQKNKPNHRVYRFQLILMKFPNLHIIWTEGKNLALPDLLSRTIDEEHFTKTRDITVELPENIKFFFAKTPFTNNLECKYSVCNNPTDENTDRTHYPVLANIHNNYFEINIDKNTYNPISYEKYNTETKTNLIPKYKPKIKDWQSPTIEKDDLIINKNQKGPYTIHHDDDYLRLINVIKQSSEYDNVKISDIFYDEKTKVTEQLIKETQILDPVLHRVKMWKKHNNKPHSVTLEIRGNKGLFAYFRKYKSIIIDETTELMKIIINVNKKSLQRICLPLTLLLCVFYENHCIDLVGHTGLEKTKRNIMEKFYFPNLATWIKILIADCIPCQTNKVFANTKIKSKQEQLAPTKKYFNEMIMIDTKGPIYPTSEGNNYIFVIVDAFSHYVTIMCAPKNTAHYAFTALFEHWFMKFGLPDEIRSDNGSEYINTELTHLCNYFEIKFKPSTTYAPWTNGLVEGTNRIIGQFIRTLLNEKYNNWSRKAKFFPYAYNTQYQTRLGMSPYEVVFNQKPRQPTKIKLGTTTDEMGNCNPSDTSACNKQPTHTHLEKQFNHPKIAKLQKGTFAKWFLDKEKHYNDTYQRITKILQNRKKLTDEMNIRFRTAKPLEKNTFVLLTNQQQIEGVSKKLLPLKTGPYIIIDKPTDTTYILKDNNKEQITIHRNHIVPYYPKEKHIKLELQNYLLTNEIPTLKQPNSYTDENKINKNNNHTEPKHTHKYNLRKIKVTMTK